MVSNSMKNCLFNTNADAAVGNDAETAADADLAGGGGEARVARVRPIGEHSRRCTMV